MIGGKDGDDHRGKPAILLGLLYWVLGSAKRSLFFFGASSAAVVAVWTGTGSGVWARLTRPNRSAFADRAAAPGTLDNGLLAVNRIAGIHAPAAKGERNKAWSVGGKTEASAAAAGPPSLPAPGAPSASGDGPVVAAPAPGSRAAVPGRAAARRAPSPRPGEALTGERPGEAAAPKGASETRQTTGAGDPDQTFDSGPQAPAAPQAAGVAATASDPFEAQAGELNDRIVAPSARLSMIMENILDTLLRKADTEIGPIIPGNQADPYHLLDYCATQSLISETCSLRDPPDGLYTTFTNDFAAPISKLGDTIQTAKQVVRISQQCLLALPGLSPGDPTYMTQTQSCFNTTRTNLTAWQDILQASGELMAKQLNEFPPKLNAACYKAANDPIWCYAGSCDTVQRRDLMRRCGVANSTYQGIYGRFERTINEFGRGSPWQRLRTVREGAQLLESVPAFEKELHQAVRLAENFMDSSPDLAKTSPKQFAKIEEAVLDLRTADGAWKKFEGLPEEKKSGAIAEFGKLTGKVAVDFVEIKRLKGR